LKDYSYKGPDYISLADIEVAIRAVDMDSRARLLCYPRGSFYPLSSVPPMKDRRIIKTNFRSCSTRLCRSQASLCLCTFTVISIHGKLTFVSLRYLLAGYRPSKTARQTGSLNPYAGFLGKICHNSKGGVSLLPEGSLLL